MVLENISSARFRLRKIAIAVAYVTLGVVSTTATIPAAYAQSNQEGYIYGNARGGAGAKVTAKNLDTGFSRETIVPENGVYRLTGLPIGKYRVSITVGGKSQTADVTVSIGEGSAANFELAAAPTELGDIVVTASQLPAVDSQSVESATNISIERAEQLPIPRNLSSVQLLAPDAIRGSADFTTQQGQPLISFGGASPLENAFFINGFNVTDFRRGLGSSEIPFEFLKEVQLKTGGYSAEFGRSLGGVINAVSKTGTNDFRAGGNVYFEPDSLRSDQPNASLPDGSPYVVNSEDYRQTLEANLSASGPIVRDRLFAYGMIGIKKLDQEDLTGQGTVFNTVESKEPSYWAFNVLGNIVDGHSLQITAFSDERDRETLTQGYDLQNKTVLSSPYDGLIEQTTGGQTYILNYSGVITDWMSISALYGHGEIKDNTDAARVDGSPCPVITDSRGEGSVPLGCVPTGTSGFETEITDTRDAYRLDFTFNFQAAGFHSLRAGFDREDLETEIDQQNVGGGIRYTYDVCENADGCNLNGTEVANGSEYLRQRVIFNRGSFNNILTAFYIQDQWQVTSKLALALGLRNDTFDLRDLNDNSFIDLKDQLGARLGFSYDLFGDSSAKVYGNYGRYFMPIETNTAVRNLTVRQDVSTYYTYDSIGPDGLPVNPVAISPGAGETSEGAQPAYDQDLKPTSQDEFILGYQQEIWPRWVGGVKGTYRKLNDAIEDVCFFSEELDYGCVIVNPGNGAKVRGQDYDFDGTPDYVDLSNEDLGGIPEAERKYLALNFSMERVWDGKWFVNANYTWSHSYGNYEGYAQSDIGQSDPGISITFDNPALVAHGDLPNDRRHLLKLYGAYSVTEEVSVGANFSWASGRPFNKFGIIPDDTPGFHPDPDTNNAIIGAYNGAYDGEFAYVNGQRVGRGASGRLPSIITLDLSTRYQPMWLQGMTIGLDVFNVLNKDSVTTVNEEFELTSGQNEGYGLPRYAGAYQSPRSVRFSVGYEFRGY